MAAGPRVTLVCVASEVTAMAKSHKQNSATQKIVFVVLAAACSQLLLSPSSAQTRPTRFWNLTRHTISEFYLAPAGTTDWGPNQCKNDKDGTVDSDERLRITGVAAGHYDAKLTDVSGRSCLVRNIKVDVGEIFSIEEKDLTECSK
jgi:hypothetical protein